MSQQQVAPYPPYLMVPVRESNGLGVAGFFIAFIGLFIPTGVIALLGLLVSLVALGRAPRGFAGIGVLIGLLGTVFWLVVMGVVVAGGLTFGAAVLVGVAVAFVLTNPELIEFSTDSANVTLAVVEYEDHNGALPAQIGELKLPASTLTDPWGNPYHYGLDPDNDDFGFDLVSSGPDGVPGTDDDWALSQIGVVWENAFENIGVTMDEFGQRMERFQQRQARRNGGRHRGIHDRHGHEEVAEEDQYEAAVLAAARAQAAVRAAEEAIDRADAEVGETQAQREPAEPDAPPSPEPD